MILNLGLNLKLFLRNHNFNEDSIKHSLCETDGPKAFIIQPCHDSYLWKDIWEEHPASDNRALEFILKVGLWLGYAASRVYY